MNIEDKIKDLEQRIDALLFIVGAIAERLPDKEASQIYLYLDSALSSGVYDQKPGEKGVLSNVCDILRRALGAVPGQEPPSYV